MGKRISKKLKREKGDASRPRPRFWPAGRSRPSSPARLHLPSPAPASTRDGRPRRAAVASRQGSATTWRACTGVDAPSRPPGAPGHARLPLRCHSRSPALPLSLSRPRSARTEHRHRHWSSEPRSGRSSSTCEPFVNSSLRELRPRFAVAGHASERLVTHGEPRSPSLSSPARAPSPRVWPARHRAFLHRLASASCSPLHHEAPEPLQSRSTRLAPRVDVEQRHRSAMASGELAPVRPRPRIGAHLVRLEP